MNVTETRDAKSAPSMSAEAAGDSTWGGSSRVWAIAAAIVGVFALAGGLLTPRGPISSGEAAMSLVIAFGIGLVVGRVTGSRWWMLVAPVLYAAVFEITRMGVDGPTVDAIRLSSTYGVIAFVVGRLAHGIIVLAPLAIGTGIGWGMRGRLGRPTWGRLGWPALGVLALSMAALVIALSRPASTAPIFGTAGEPPAGSIAELTTVEIGGHEQSVMIRGRAVENPILLYLAGGPGGTDIGAMRLDSSLESDFVVVTWDQRGTGKSYAAIDPVETLTVDQMVSDTIELTEHLIDRFGHDQVYLVGNSWGSLLGVLAISERPDLYAAYVGIGQMVSPRGTDVMFWEDALAWAEQTGDTDLADTLRSNGPPPYDDLLDYEAAVGSEHLWNDYPEFDPGNEMPAILFVPEYDLMEKINGFRGFLDTFSVLYPQLQDVDFRSQIDSLAVPAFMVTGEHEARGRATLAHEWFDALDAPEKVSVEFVGAGHRAHFDRPDLFADFMQSVVLQVARAGER